MLRGSSCQIHGHVFQFIKTPTEVLNLVFVQERPVRARLAADVVCDPPPSNIDGCSADYNFPTFVSPYEHPAKSASAGQPRKGMAIPLVYCDQTASQRPVTEIDFKTNDIYNFMGIKLDGVRMLMLMLQPQP